MKQQYKIVRDPKPLTDEQIDRHKDFNKLINNYAKIHQYGVLNKPFFKNYGLLSMVVLIGIVALVFILDEEKNTPEVPETPTSNSSTVKSTESTSPGTPEVQLDPKGVPTIVANKSDSAKKSVADIRWDYVVEFDATQHFVYQLDNGVRVLIDANSLEIAKGKPLKGKAELLYRKTSDFSDKVAVKFRSEEFEIRVREKGSNAMAELIRPALVEVPLKLQNKALVHEWNATKNKWQSMDNTLKFRFEINAGQAPYTTLEHHVWEMQYKSVEEYLTNQYIFGKSWRQFEWNVTSSLRLKGTQGSATLNARPARIYASDKLQKEFEDQLFNCYSKKLADTCAGSTRIKLWKATNPMYRYNMATVSIEIKQSGIFLIDYDNSSSVSEKLRTLNIGTYPVDTRNGNQQQNEE